MEVVTFSVLSAILFNVLCIISYLFYKRYRATTVSDDSVLLTSKLKTENKSLSKKMKQNAKKTKQKKNPPQNQKKQPAIASADSDTESQTTEQQLAQTIISQQQYAQDSINTTAVNAKPTIKKLTPTQRSNSKTRGGVTEVVERDPDWENVISRKKKKLYPVTKNKEKWEFTIDEEGGIVETKFCEINLPPEAVKRPTKVFMEVEKYEKFVDETEEKVFVTSALHFTTEDGSTKLQRQFTMKVITMKLMGRDWDGNVSCQIETKDADDEWVTTGRTEYIFGKPVQIVADELSSYRVVITRGQNGAIHRDLQIAAYIAKPKFQNPTHHFLHLCIYDKSQQSQYKVETNMQKLILKMPPRDCSVPFGSNVEFKIRATQKYTPETKDIFMRWTEVCKPFVNVRFQIRLNRNKTDNPNFEAEYRTVVYLSILKVRSTVSITQEEYFHFYWISATLFPKKRKFQGQIKVEERLSEDDGFASGSDLATTSSDLERPSKKSSRSSNFKKGNSQDSAAQNKKRNQKKTKKISLRTESTTQIPTQNYSDQSKVQLLSSSMPSASKRDVSSVKRDRDIDKVKLQSKNNQTLQFTKNVQSSQNAPPQKGNPLRNSTSVSSKFSNSTKTQENHPNQVSSTKNSAVTVENPPQRRIFSYRSSSKKGNQGNNVKGQENTGNQSGVTKTNGQKRNQDAAKKQDSSTTTLKNQSSVNGNRGNKPEVKVKMANKKSLPEAGSGEKTSIQPQHRQVAKPSEVDDGNQTKDAQKRPQKRRNRQRKPINASQQSQDKPNDAQKFKKPADKKDTPQLLSDASQRSQDSQKPITQKDTPQRSSTTLERSSETFIQKSQDKSNHPQKFRRDTSQRSSDTVQLLSDTPQRPSDMSQPSSNSLKHSHKVQKPTQKDMSQETSDTHQRSSNTLHRSSDMHGRSLNTSKQPRKFQRFTTEKDKRQRSSDTPQRSSDAPQRSSNPPDVKPVTLKDTAPRSSDTQGHLQKSPKPAMQKDMPQRAPVSQNRPQKQVNRNDRSQKREQNQRIVSKPLPRPSTYSKSNSNDGPSKPKDSQRPLPNGTITGNSNSSRIEKPPQDGAKLINGHIPNGAIAAPKDRRPRNRNRRRDPPGPSAQSDMIKTTSS